VKIILVVFIVLSFGFFGLARSEPITTYEMQLIEIEGTLKEQGNEQGQGKSPPSKIEAGSCGADCRDALPEKKGAPPPITPLQPVPGFLHPVSVADQDLKRAIYEFELEHRARPLETSSVIIEKAADKLTDLLPSPLNELVDMILSVEDDPGLGISDFDRARSKEEMNRMRFKLENEERRLRERKEKEAEAFEANFKTLFADPIESPHLNRGPASNDSQAVLEKVIRERAQKVSDDLYIITDQILRRTKADAPIPLTRKSIPALQNVLKRAAIVNHCEISKGRSCMINGQGVGRPCFCDYQNRIGLWTRSNGTSKYSPLGNACKWNHAVTDLTQQLPIGFPCEFPMNLAFTPGYFNWHMVQGKVIFK